MAQELKAEHAAGLEIALKAMLKHRVAKGGVHLDALAMLEGMIEEASSQLPSQWGEAVEVVATVESYGGHWAGIHWGDCIGSTEDPGRQLMTVAQHQRILAASAPKAEPVGEVLCDGDMVWQVDGDPAVWRRLGEGAKLYTHSAGQVEDCVRLDGLVRANQQMGRIYLHFKTTEQQHVALRELRQLLADSEVVKK